MNSLELLKAKINLKTTLLKFRLSIEEIEKNHPNRKDLINSMAESLDDLERFQSIFKELEDEYYLECKNHFRSHLVIAELKHEIDKLRIEIIDLNREL
tara:strand:- start:8311 stop:8604 length:294 start_codon:yes stop_codon:yes gene_type:complete